MIFLLFYKLFVIQYLGCNDAQPPLNCVLNTCYEIFKGSCDLTWKDLDSSCNYETKVKDVCMKMCGECQGTYEL